MGSGSCSKKADRHVEWEDTTTTFTGERLKASSSSCLIPHLRCFGREREEETARQEFEKGTRFGRLSLLNHFSLRFPLPLCCGEKSVAGRKSEEASVLSFSHRIRVVVKTLWLSSLSGCSREGPHRFVREFVVCT